MIAGIVIGLQLGLVLGCVLTLLIIGGTSNYDE